MVVLGVVCLIAAAGLFYAGTRFQAKAADIVGRSTSTCAELAGLAGAIGAELGRDAFRRQVEVVGKAQPGPGGPLTAPLSGRAVVWWRTRVEHEYWDHQTRTDSDGRRRSERVRRTETMAEQSSSERFRLADETGSASLDPALSIDHPSETHDEFRAPDAAPGLVGVVLRRLDATIGYRYREWALSVDQRLYVLGEATSGDDGVLISKPSEKGTRSMISTKTEAELLSSSKSGARGMAVASIVVGVLGAVFVVIGVVS